ncbi:MAG: GNAT family N-acetyltransferase, partial [Bacteroidales bacterium]|nr:GNAT family N-acetyltransferase [Bacteroidales bacterium]
PGELYNELRDKTLREYWPAFFTQFNNDESETDPGEYYLDSLAVHPSFRRMGIGRALLEDGIKIGLSEGFTQIALVADAEMPRLINLYASIGFVPADHRNVFGTDFLRMLYTV